MIINFSVQNFGSIKDKQTLSFEADKSKHLEDIYVIKTETGHRLLKLGLVYGQNASGKTTLFNATNFLRTLTLFPKEKKTDELDFIPFLFDDNTPNQNTIISVEFIKSKVRYYYEVEFFRKAIVKEALFQFKPKKSSIFNRTTDLKNQFSEIKFGTKIKIDKTSKKALELNTLWNNTVLSGFLKTNMELKELKEVTDWFNLNWSSLTYPMLYNQQNFYQALFKFLESKEQKDFVLGILQKADFNISNLFVDVNDNLSSFFENYDFSNEQISKAKLNADRKLEFEHNVKDNKYILPYNLESQGTRRFLELAAFLKLTIDSPFFLSIDELEASLHPDLYQHFLLSFLMNSKNSQILATTHNREILNNKDIFRDDAIWIADKNNPACATELYSFADFDTSVIRDTTNRLNAYKSGKLGGVPNLGDYFIDSEK